MVWRNKSFGDCAELVRDVVQPGDAQGMPYIGLEHISQGQLFLLGFGKSEDVISAKSRFRSGDILFGKLRSYFRKVILAPFDGVCSTDIWVVRSKPGVVQRFLFYWMASEEFIETSNRASEGTKMPRAQWEYVERIQQKIPEETEQRAIADVLGALDDKIELNRRMNATLEAMASALFKRWFVDNEEVGNWENGRLSDLCEPTIGGDWGEDKKNEDSVPVICLRGVDLEKLRKEGYAEDAPVRWIKKSSFEKRKLSSYDILIAGSGIGPVGRPLWVNPEMPKAYSHPVIYSNFVKRFRAKSPEYAVYVDRVLFNMRESNEIWDYINGTSIPNLNDKDLLAYHRISIPPEKLVKGFYDYVRPIYAKLYNKESRTLAALRDVLLPRLMRGEIRVKDIA